MIHIAIFGLGEAGTLIGSDLLSVSKANGKELQLFGYDPAEVATPDGVVRTTTPEEAVENADYVFSFTGSVDATTALNQAISSVPTTAIYADFASASAGLKRQLHSTASGAGFKFCDVALMAMVPGNGIKTPAMLSGNGASELSELLGGFGMPVQVVSDKAGDAAERKLLRSVVIKGLSGLLIEAMEGANKAGCEAWLWQNLVDQFAVMDKNMLQRLVTGTGIHAERRYHEMVASAEQLIELGVEPLMTQSTVANLDKVKREGLPDVPSI